MILLYYTTYMVPIQLMLSTVEWMMQFCLHLYVWVYIGSELSQSIKHRRRCQKKDSSNIDTRFLLSCYFTIVNPGKNRLKLYSRKRNFLKILLGLCWNYLRLYHSCSTVMYENVWKKSQLYWNGFKDISVFFKIFY